MEKILEKILNELKELKTRQERIEDKIDSLRMHLLDLTPSAENPDKQVEDSNVKNQTRFERYSRPSEEEYSKKGYEELQTIEQISTTIEEEIQEDSGLAGITTDPKVTKYLSNPKKKELRNLVKTAVEGVKNLFPDRRITLEIRGELLFLEIEGKDEKDIQTLNKLDWIYSSFEEFIIDLDFQ